MLVTWLVELFFAGQLHSDFRDIIISPVAGQDPADHAGDLAGGAVLDLTGQAEGPRAGRDVGVRHHPGKVSQLHGLPTHQGEWCCAGGESLFWLGEGEKLGFFFYRPVNLDGYIRVSKWQTVLGVEHKLLLDLFTCTIWAYFVHLNFQHMKIQISNPKITYFVVHSFSSPEYAQF